MDASTSLKSQPSEHTDTSAPACSVDTCGPTNTDVSGEGLSAEELHKIADLPIQDKDGKSHTFKSIVKAPGIDRHLVIFVRNWFCRNCQQYIHRINEYMANRSLPPRTAMSFVGCGSPNLIEHYQSQAKCSYPIYADPSTGIYKALGMGKTLDGGPKPDYVQEGFLAGVIKGTAWGLSTGPMKMFGKGDIDQIGGELLFDVSEKAGEDGWKCDYIHRMKYTRDHLEVTELMKLVGVEKQ